MNKPRLLLCTDMDRTIIPNGTQPEHPGARRMFADFCRLPAVTLVYVTGRHQALVQQAISDYALPEPDFVITDVGTKIYQLAARRWQEWAIWAQEIGRDWIGKTHQQLQQLLNDIPGPYLQEQGKQNTHKLSYYVPLSADPKSVLAQMQTRLDREDVAATLIWSVDEPNRIGLLDVLPRNATKLHAIEFLQAQLGYRLGEVIFAGDSGNDLPVLTSAIPSVLVANASAEVKQTAQNLAKQNGHADALYLAKDGALNLNGNYAAGVLQGIWHFAPAFRDKIQPGGKP